MNDLSGSIIKGYKLEEKLGGGMGDVYRAKHPTFGTDVAMKVIKPQFANEPEFIRRFELEAQLINRLEHLHIVPLHDFWRDNNGAYLIMRWLRGGSLRNQLTSNGGMSTEDIVKIVGQVAQGLHHAHRNQIIHRDIKPENILLDEDGNAYVADFGIAKDHVSGTNMTGENWVGTPGYVAPEQARGEQVTPQSDIYSLGIVLFEMLEQQHPFPNTDAVALIFKQIEERLPDLQLPEDDIRDELNDVIQKATSKDPTQRFRDIMEFAQALQEAAKLTSSQVEGFSLAELLTPREQEVMQLIIDGKSNREIADMLVLEITTVKSYITSIYRKLKVRSRVQAIARARDLKFVIQKPKTKSAIGTGLLPEPTNPYKGLNAFTAGDAHQFFGRELLVNKLLQRMQEDVEHQRFIAIVGPSGSGKSSVTKAGLIPALWRGDLPSSDNWYIAEMLPRAHPIDNLEIALVKIASENPQIISEQLNRDTRGLLRIANMILPDDGSELLIVIDQFEEVFTLVEDEKQRLHFLNLIREAVIDPDSRVRIIVTLRADYYDRPLQYPEFGVLMRNRLETVLPLTADELEQAIKHPAENVGVRFENGLVSKIVSDVHYQPGALPLLQYALTELFERRDGRNLTLAAYTDIGGTGGALAKRADEIYLEGNEDGQALVKQLFLRLVTLGEGAEDTRRRVDRSELLEITDDPELMDEIIDIYAQSRLLSLDHDPSTRKPTVEVAHEAILREWERLREWLNNSRDDIKQERQIAHEAEAWQTNNRDKSYLRTGSKLDQAEQWQQSTQLAITPLVSEFIQTSTNEANARKLAERERREREKQQEAEKQRLTERALKLSQRLVAVFIVATLIAGGLAVFAFVQRNDAVSAREQVIDEQENTLEALDIAKRSSFAFAANSAIDRQEYDLAIALAVESATGVETLLPETLHILERISTDIGPKMIIDNEGHRCSPTTSPDGQYIITGNFEDSIILWDSTTGEKIQTFKSDVPITSCGDINEDNTRLFALNWVTDTLTTWDVATGNLISTININLNDESFFLFWPTWDENLFLIGIGDPSVRSQGLRSAIRYDFYDIRTGEIAHQLQFDDIHHNLINFSADWSLGITSGWVDIEKRDTYRAYVFDVETGEIIETYERPVIDMPPDVPTYGGRTGPTGIGFSEDMTKILIGGYPNYIIDRATNTDVLVFDVAPIIQMWGTLQEYAILQDATTNTFIANTTTGESTPIGSFHFTPYFGVDHNTVVANMNQNPDYLQIWDISHRNMEVQLLSSTTIWSSNAFSPDGAFVATVSGWQGNPDSHLQVTSVEDGENLYKLGDDNFLGFDLAWSPDGSMIAAGLADGSLLIIDAFSGEEIHRLTDGSDKLYMGTMDFTPDGRYVVAAHTVFDPSQVYDVAPSFTVWDTETGEIVSHVEMPPGEALENYGINRIRLHPTQPIAYVAVNENWGVIENNAYIVDIFSGEILHELGLALVGDIVFTQDGNLVIAAFNGEIYVVSVETGEIIREWDSLVSEHFRGIDLSPDGKYLATGSLELENTVTLWDFETGAFIRRFLLGGQQDAVSDVDFSPDGTKLATGSTGSTVSAQLWELDTTTPLDWVLENRHVREFTCTERELYRIEPLCEDEE